MFASLKNKIREETGTDVTLQSRFVSLSSEQRDTEPMSYTELERQLGELQKSLESVQEERTRLETTNVLMEESLRLAQEQKDLISDEHDKIQNLQHKENEKLKHLLLFKDQEAVDRATALKTSQIELDKCKQECIRLQGLESMLEDLKDDLERLRHSAQSEKTQFSTLLGSVQEENRHLKTRLEIIVQSRVGTSDAAGNDDQVRSLLQERKLLEQRLEEAHLHLIDVKSNWSGQNLSLETQVARLSRQVAEETADKRKALKSRDQFLERIKELEKELDRVKVELSQKDNKIRLLNEELEDMNEGLKEMQRKQEQRDGEVKKEIEEILTEKEMLQEQLTASEQKLKEQLDLNATLQKDLSSAHTELQELSISLEKERAERVTILLKNAELTQNEESLKQDLKQERDDLEEWLEKVKTLQRTVVVHEKNEKDLMLEIEGLNIRMQEKENLENEFLLLTEDVNEKNKTIKVLNQRLVDMKKTLQEEIRGNRDQSSDDLKSSYQHINKPEMVLNTCNGVVTMDEISFKYLKHVIIKFVTCRDVEAKQLLRAVSTILRFSNEEERLLYEMYKWKMSWFFGAKPDVGQWSS